MTLYVVTQPDPPAGTDFSFVVPGRYTYDVTGITATLTTVPLLPILHDSSGNGHDGLYITNFGPYPKPAPGLVAGDGAIRWGSRAAPIGNSHALVTAPIIDWRGDFTVEALIARDAVNPQQVFVAAADDGGGNNVVTVLIGVTGAIQVIRNSVPQEVHQTAAGAFPADGAAHRLSVTYTAVTCVIRVGGVTIAQTVNNPHHVIAVNALRVDLGADASGAGAGGSIQDETAIYGFALTGAQDAAHQAAVAGGFATYSAAVLANGPAAYYHHDEGSSTGRQPSLIVNDGTTELEAIPTGFPAVATPGPYDYSWQPRLNADTQSTDGTLTTVAIPRLLLPAGYVVGARTLDLQSGDQWSNVTLWWDDAYQEAVNPSQPWEYPPGALLKFVQSGG